MENTFQSTQSGQGELKNYYDMDVTKEALKRKRKKMMDKQEANKLGIDPNAVAMYNQLKK